MKSLSKRNLTVLATAGVLIIIVFAMVAFSQVSGNPLFGTVAYPYINPANPSINVGQSITLTVVSNPVGVAPNCTFTTPSTAVTLSGALPRSVNVTGMAAGYATITATCNVGTVSTTATVHLPIK